MGNALCFGNGILTSRKYNLKYLQKKRKSVRKNGSLWLPFFVSYDIAFIRRRVRLREGEWGTLVSMS